MSKIHSNNCCLGPPPEGFVEQALNRGTKYLGLSPVSANGPEVKPNFPKSNQLEYLDLNGSNMEKEYFRQLIFSCQNLTKLSVQSFIGEWNSEDLVTGIAKNASTLKVLDISKCSKLHPHQIMDIVTFCVNLSEANFGDTEHSEDSLTFICEHLTPTIRKLRLFEDLNSSGTETLFEK